MTENKTILRVSDVNKFFKKRNSLKHALKNINFEVQEGDFFGIIGESGSGKTTLGRSIIRLNDISGGNIYLYDKLISSKKINKREKNYICNNIQMIFQDPMSSLNPKMNILKIISEPLVINKEIVDKVNKLIEKKEKLNYFLEYKLLEGIKKIQFDKEKKYFQKYIEIVENKTKEIIDFKFSNEDDWVTSFNEIDDLYNTYIASLKLNIDEFSKIADEQDEFIRNVYELNDVPEELKVYINFGSVESQEEKLIKDNLEKLKEEFSNKQAIKKSQEEKKIIKMIYKDFKIQSKFYKNRSKLEKTKLAYYNDIIMSKNFETNAKFVKSVFNLNYIDEQKLNRFVSEITSKINDYFKKINEKLMFKESNQNKEFEIKTLISDLNINKYVQNILSDKIKELNKEDEINKTEFEKSIKKLEKEIESTKNKHSKIINNKKDNFNLENYNYIFKEYKNSYEKFIKDSKLIQSEINNLKEDLKDKKSKLESELKKQVSKLYKLRPSALKTFSKKEAKDIVNKNTKSFKTQIKTKNKTLDSIDFEYKNIQEIIFINTKLSSRSKFKLWFYKGELVKLLTMNKVFKLLESVGLKKEHAYRYPHEFSGGQRQRIVIARSLITNPKLIIADEAISALDVSVQAQVINILKKLSDEKGMTFLFIAHDLSMVKHICNKVIIMHNGSIVEKGLVSKIFENPVHPYTKSLFTAIPELSRMDVDLAAGEDNISYDSDYSISNMPTFFKVSEGHEVLATEEQFKKWVN